MSQFFHALSWYRGPVRTFFVISSAWWALLYFLTVVQHTLRARRSRINKTLNIACHFLTLAFIWTTIFSFGEL